MALDFDISDDFDLFDDVHTVSYQRRALDGTYTTDATVSAFKRATTGAIVDLGGSQVVVDMARWHIKAGTLSGSPRRGDRIVSGTYGTWEVIDDNAETFLTRHMCYCKRIPAA